jgi:hypothetical protein
VAQGAWISLLLGTAGLFCGGILLASAVIAEREDLWAVGMPIALLSQIVLLIGLALRMERMPRDGGSTAAKADDIHRGVGEARGTTPLSSPPASTAGGTRFHSAETAGPGAVLDDLKHRLEMLARKIDQT